MRQITYITIVLSIFYVAKCLNELELTSMSASILYKGERLESLMAAKAASDCAYEYCAALFKETGKQMEEKFNKLSKKTEDPQKNKENLMNMVKMYKYSSKFTDDTEEVSEENSSYKIVETREKLKKTFIKTIEDAKAA